MAVGLAATLAAGCRDEGAEDTSPAAAVAEEVEALSPQLLASLPPGSTPEMAQEGRRLFVTCATCHGLDARGTQLGPSLRDGEWLQGDGSLESIQEVIRTGVAEPEEFPIPMPVMGGGSYAPDEIRALATYVYAISRSRSAALPDSAAEERQ